MSFSFDGTAGTSQSTSKSKLEVNKIHTVALESCELQEIVGVKDITAVYKVLKLRFSNDDGYYEHTVFEPRPDDFKREIRTVVDKKTGKENKIPQASGVESMMLLFKHIIDAFVPEVGKKIDNKEVSLGAANWDELRKLIKKILDRGKGKTSSIKLIKNSKGEPIFPSYFAGLTREGVAYVRNNFIGEKLAFTPYETDQFNKEASAKITPASGFNFNDGESNSSNDSDDMDLDFEVGGI